MSYVTVSDWFDVSSLLKLWTKVPYRYLGSRHVLSTTLLKIEAVI
jgi:hypothetical protein